MSLDRPGAVELATEVTREEGQYLFGPAAFDLDHEHSSAGVATERHRSAYGVPVVNPDTGYGYVEFTGNNRFVADREGGDRGYICETYCADPAIEREPEFGRRGYGSFVSEYMPYC